MRYIKTILRILYINSWWLRINLLVFIDGKEGLSRIIEKVPRYMLNSVLRKYGATIGNNCLIDQGLTLHRMGKWPYLQNLILRNDIHIGKHCLLDLSDEIVFEDNTALGAYCQLWTHTGDYDKKLWDTADYREKVLPIKLKEGSVCYSGVVINPGVTIGQNCRVGANSVVLKDVTDNSFYGGIPAKKISDRVFVG